MMSLIRTKKSITLLFFYSLIGPVSKNMIAIVKDLI